MTTARSKKAQGAPTEQSKGNKPVVQVKSGRVKLALWIERKEGDDGDQYDAYNLKLERSYKVDGEWTQQSMWLNRQEVDDVVNVIETMKPEMVTVSRPNES